MKDSLKWQLKVLLEESPTYRRAGLHVWMGQSSEFGFTITTQYAQDKHHYFEGTFVWTPQGLPDWQNATYQICDGQNFYVASYDEVARLLNPKNERISG